MAVLRDRYFQEIVPQLREQYQYKSPMQIPRIVKIILNMGLGEAIQNVKILDSGVGRAIADKRTKAGYHQGAPEHRRLQAQEGHADRVHGYTARPPDVRVFR